MSGCLHQRLGPQLITVVATGRASGVKILLQNLVMPQLSSYFIPHRLSRGSTRGASSGVLLARDEKCATAARVSLITSRLPCKIAGDMDDDRKEVRLRVGTLNVGTMRGRSGEVVEMAKRRKLDLCCVQETRWKGGSAKMIGSDDGWYKFFWVGCEKGEAGVGVLVAAKWVNSVIEVRRVNERVMVLRLAIGKSLLNVVSVYAPQVGRSPKEKEDFYVCLGNVLKGVSKNEKLLVCGDLNAHVGAEADGFEGVHGGKGFGVRNTEGEVLLEFADAWGLTVCNTWFIKPDSQKITYESGGIKTQVDYVLIRKEERPLVSNVKVIQSEACIPQHKLVVCEMKLVEKLEKKRKVFVSKCRVWKLKEKEQRLNFEDKIKEKAELRGDGDVESKWKMLKETLLEAADEVCGRTKGPARHRESWWWNREVSEVIDEKRKLYMIWKKSGKEEDRVLYCSAKRKARRAVYIAQSEEQKVFGEMLDSEVKKGTVHRVVKQGG